MLAFPAYHCGQPLPQSDRSNDQLSIIPLSRIACQKIEKLGTVHTEIGMACEESNVGINPCRCRIVVSRAQVHVTAKRVPFLPDHQRQFGVRLQTEHAVDHMSAYLLQ